jgi:2-amino-4-hydroxy-6-hydroxymethyldihydropteridine diphosphokinase
VATGFIALGGNLGDRPGYLRAAVAGLRAAGVDVQAVSPVFETEAVAAEAQPRYLNAVVRVETALSPRALLEQCLAVERALGRVRPSGTDKAPRTIDLDLLLLGDAVIAEPGLHLPHPRLLDRPFVRIPLAHVASPGLRHPVTGDPLDHAPAHPDVVRNDHALVGW